MSLVTSPNDFKYYVIFINDHSRYTWLYSLKHKSDVEQAFLSFNTLIEFDKRLKCLQIDMGGEYIALAKIL